MTFLSVCLSCLSVSTSDVLPIYTRLNGQQDNSKIVAKILMKYFGQTDVGRLRSEYAENISIKSQLLQHSFNYNYIKLNLTQCVQFAGTYTLISSTIK